MATKQTKKNSQLTERRELRFSPGQVISLFIFMLVAIVMVNALDAKSEMFTSGKWRYRMTVTVETPEGIKTGSAVREVRVEKGLKLLPEMGASVELTGEAVVVDLGKRGVLFALINGDDAWRIIFDLFPVKDLAPLTAEGIRYYSGLKNAKASLQAERYPTFVRFRDLNDPKSVEDVRPSEVIDKFKAAYPNRQIVSPEEAFGHGVRIKEVTLEMTEETPTQTVGKFLPWLQDYYDKMLDGRRYNFIDAENKLANSLSSGAFATGGINNGR